MMTESNHPINNIESKNFDLSDDFVAPWGLAKEERPLHYIWEGELDYLRLKFAKPVEVIEFFNVPNGSDSYLVDGEGNDEVKVFDIPSEELISEGYFSGVFQVPKLLEQPIVGQVVEAVFKGDDWTESIKDLTFTVRPMIQLVNLPEKIETFDDEVKIVYEKSNEDVEVMEYPGKIYVDLQQIGFGMAQVEPKAWGEGELISKRESVYQDLVRELSNSLTAKNASLQEVPEDTKNEVNLEIPENTIENVVSDFREWLSQKSLGDEFAPEELEELSRLVGAENTEFDMGDVYKHFEYLLMNSILDVVDRHPSNNVQMKSPQTNIEIQSTLESFKIIFELSDNLGNEYESEVIEIDIEDERSNGGIAELELVTNWKEVELDPSELDKLREEVESDL